MYLIEVYYNNALLDIKYSHFIDEMCWKLLLRLSYVTDMQMHST